MVIKAIRDVIEGEFHIFFDPLVKENGVEDRSDYRSDTGCAGWPEDVPTVEEYKNSFGDPVKRVYDGDLTTMITTLEDGSEQVMSWDKSWSKEWSDFVPDDSLSGTCWDVPVWLEDCATETGAMSYRPWCKTLEDWEEALMTCYTNLETAKSWDTADPDREAAINRMKKQIGYCKQQIAKFEDGDESDQERRKEERE